MTCSRPGACGPSRDAGRRAPQTSQEASGAGGAGCGFAGGVALTGHRTASPPGGRGPKRQPASHAWAHYEGPAHPAGRQHPSHRRFSTFRLTARTRRNRSADRRHPRVVPSAQSGSPRRMARN